MSLNSFADSDWDMEKYLDNVTSEQNYMKRCTGHYLRSGSEIIEKTEVAYKGTAEVDWQAICVCDERFKKYRNDVNIDPENNYCKATVLNGDICKCYSEANKKHVELNHGALAISSEPKYNPNPKDNKNYDRTIVVVTQFKPFPSLKDAQKNPTVKTKVKFIGKDINCKKFVDEGSTTTHLTFCGDGVVQVDNGEKCDEGLNNGNPWHCDCECKGTVKNDSKGITCK